jgi:hypothetical protein
MKRVKSLMIGLLITAGLMEAETVYFGETSGAYHLGYTACARSGAGYGDGGWKYHSERSVAEAHGLKPCKRCYSPKVVKPKRGAWAKQAPKTTTTIKPVWVRPCETDSECEGVVR